MQTVGGAVVSRFAVLGCSAINSDERIAMRAIWHGLKKVELYECVGLLFSLFALAVFFLYADLADLKQQKQNWHWHPVRWVWDVYRAFLPKAFGAGLALLLAVGWWKHRDLRWGMRHTLILTRLVLPFCLLLFIYRVLNFYVPLFSPLDRDDWLLHADRWLFGVQPTIWLQQFVHPLLTDCFSFAYMAWFPLIFVTMVLLHFLSKKAVTEYTASVLFTFYLGYFCYLLIPAVGPYYTLQQTYSISLAGGLVTAAQQNLVLPGDLNIPRDAFPSLHTAVSLVMLYFIAVYRPRWLWLYVPLVASILLSTVYLRYHYVIDVIAGIALGLFTSVYSGRWCRKWRELLGPQKKHRAKG
ncbi:phosphatase PAP2 family protein [Brevibacillus massiliensis]|uniref:phosphatase PAP2 family protein n=1 Tax=Brevibacillus massiliensis TaxID=1118054 RepID=UPI00137574D1|nr:phosphatase PAP2 family protein [Brevibacillus massiliensis]